MHQTLIDLFDTSILKKLTGPPEHWLTTFHTGFWGLEKKHHDKWRKLKENDICLFHSTDTVYLYPKPKISKGIIGLGVVGSTNKKDTLEWIGEIQSTQNQWPYLINFKELFWFGLTSKIENETIRAKIAKGNQRLAEDILYLSDKAISFNEMDQHDCRIPAQGSISDLSIASNPGLKLLVSSRLGDSFSFTEQYDPSEVEKTHQSKEGAVKTITVNSYERDKNARQECIKVHGAKCQICEFDFSKIYGQIGDGFIHVHHKVPLSEIGEEYFLDPINDLVPVCPNCHAMIHRRKPVFTVEELKRLIAPKAKSCREG
ncbi:HNH endonuclease [Desulforhopalus singaporensis]|uniref:HNH endonuclease n=1 Tax=Desulforhopalus singaporensis TaxID=91360 RepID=A0A1H0VJ69_9BACT|nr:HNH endonuclease [Desulforhopalus singaporensis]SDP78235.1 HNH endonuclease [Desulforhopalus singaporensis]